MRHQNSFVILLTLLNEPAMTLYDLSVRTKFPIKVLRAQIESLNDYFVSKGWPRLVLESESYRLPAVVREKADNVIADLQKAQLFLSQNERVHWIYLYTFCRREFVSNYHYQALLKVSKNTALADVKTLRELMARFGLSLEYSRAKGYSIEGEEADKHRLALYAISELRELPIGVWSLQYILSAWAYPDKFAVVMQHVEAYYLAFQLTPIQDRLEACVYLLLFMLYRYHRVKGYDTHAMNQTMDQPTDQITAGTRHCTTGHITNTVSERIINHASRQIADHATDQMTAVSTDQPVGAMIDGAMYNVSDGAAANPYTQALLSLSNIVIKEVLGESALETCFTSSEKQYLSGILSGCFEGDLEVNDSFFQQLIQAIIDKMEDISLLNFQRKAELIAGLKKHIIPAYFRLKYRLFSVNTYTEQIKESYPNLFTLVQRALEPLEKTVGYAIPDAEIFYFVVHFGGYLKQQLPKSYLPYRAVILCPNGVSSSLIIKENLKKIFPKIAFIGTTSVEQLSMFDLDAYDVIFSTVSIQTSKPNYLVSVMMTDEQMRSLIALVAKDFPDVTQHTVVLDKLMDTIKQYSTVHQEKTLRAALRVLLLQYKDMRKEVKPLLQELITEQTYQTCSQKLDWQSAIRLVAEPLLASGQISARYPEAMIEKVATFGPFIDLGKGIAIPHARPEDGVHQVGMSMLVLEEPVYLLDDPNHEIRVLICIAAVDNETHLKALSHLTTILRDDAHVKALVSSRQYADIAPIIQQEDT